MPKCVEFGAPLPFIDARAIYHDGKRICRRCAGAALPLNIPSSEPHERRTDVGWRGVIAPLLILTGVAAMVWPYIGLKNAGVLWGIGSGTLLSMYRIGRRKAQKTDQVPPRIETVPPAMTTTAGQAPIASQASTVVLPTKFCRKCGAKIPADSEFCETCGANLTVPEAATAAPLARPAEIVQPKAEPPEAPKARKTPIKIAIAASLVIILLIAAVFVVAYWSGERERPVLQFDGTGAVHLKTSHNFSSGAQSTSGWMDLAIYGGGNFTMESMEVSVGGTILTVTQIVLNPAPHTPGSRVSETVVTMPASMKLPADMTVYVQGTVDVSKMTEMPLLTYPAATFLLKIHVVGSWNLGETPQRVVLDAATELQWETWQP